MSDDRLDEIGNILEEMREEYWRALTETAETEEERLECVVFTLGGETYAFETCFASEVLRVPRLVRVPRVRDIIVGVFNLRGEIVAAMDIRPLLGVGKAAFGPSARILVVKSDRIKTGIIVEAVAGVTPLSFDTFQPAARSSEQDKAEFIRGHLTHEEHPVILLDIAKLLSMPEMIVE